MTFLQTLANEREAEGWQQIFDMAFPHGAVVIRDTGDPYNDALYACPKIRVLHVKGQMPGIFFAPAGLGGVRAFLLQLVAWKQLRSEPDVFAAKDMEGRSWLFSNALTNSLAGELAAIRQRAEEIRSSVLSLPSRL